MFDGYDSSVATEANCILMTSEQRFKQHEPIASNRLKTNDSMLHPAWSAFIRYCAELEHGEIEVLKIQDGLPVLAEVTRKKVKFVK